MDEPNQKTRPSRDGGKRPSRKELIETFSRLTPGELEGIDEHSQLTIRKARIRATMETKGFPFGPIGSVLGRSPAGLAARLVGRTLAGAGEAADAMSDVSDTISNEEFVLYKLINEAAKPLIIASSGDRRYSDRKAEAAERGESLGPSTLSERVKEQIVPGSQFGVNNIEETKKRRNR